MKYLLAIFLFLVVTFSWAQKKELKSAQKLFKAGKTAEAAASLDANQSVLESAELKYAAPYNLLRSQIALSEKEFKASYDFLILAKKDPKLKVSIVNQKQLLIVDLVSAAIEQSENNDYLLSAKNLYLAYEIDPVGNIDYLYFAASNAVNAPNYELALVYYNILKEIKYDGIKTEYYVTEVNGNIERVVTMAEYNIFQKSKDYMNFRTEDTDSKFPEIVKNIALIYNELGQKDKAIAAVKDARAENPGDLGLILTEANIYIELGEKEKFKDLMGEAISQDPENGTLYFNLAVVSSDLGDKENARKYYEKAIVLDPKMENSYLNLVALILEEESRIVEEMNSLGNTRAENAKYKILVEKREAVYLECVPILRKFIDLVEGNFEAINTLKNIYGTLGNTEGFMEMKRLLESIK